MFEKELLRSCMRFWWSCRNPAMICIDIFFDQQDYNNEKPKQRQDTKISRGYVAMKGPDQRETQCLIV